MSLASLPMYDLPEVREATDAWWAGLAEAFRREGLADVPDALDRTTPAHEQWRDPALLFSQSCGYPLTHAFAHSLQLVATPRYAVPGCEGTSYRSAVLVRRDDPAQALADLRGRRCAYNGADSQSGYNSLRALVAPLARNGRFFGETLESGAHRECLAMVVDGRADVAALDAVTYWLLRHHRPEMTRKVRLLAWSEPAPALPYVTHASRSEEDVARLRAGLAAAMAAPDLADARTALGLEGAEVLELVAYQDLVAMEWSAIALGYPRLA
jgi:ABC-type phosphate/phosphonate transport system substrate-binding protein